MLMKRLIVFVLIVMWVNITLAQKFAPKDYYLVDSLILDELFEQDRLLIDSCLMVYHEAKTDSNRLQAIHIIVEKSWGDNVWPKYNLWLYKTVEEHLKKELSKDIESYYKKVYAGTSSNVGLMYKIQGNYSKALIYYQQSFNTYENLNDTLGMATTLNNIAIIYDNQGDIPKALELYFKSLKVLEKVGNKKRIAIAINNIGYVYSNQGENEKALEYYNKNLKICDEINDKEGVALAYNNIGVVYDNRGQLSEAIENYHRSLEIQESINNKRGIAVGLNNLGFVYKKKGELDIALDYYKRSIPVYKEIGHKQGIAISFINIGTIYQSKNNIEQALTYGEKGLVIAQEIGFPDIIQKAAGLLSSVLEQQGKFPQAIKMYKLHITMRDSINDKKNQKAAIRQQAKYEYEKQKAIDDAENEKLLAIEKEKEEKQRLISYATAGGLGLTGIFLFIVFNRLRVTRQQKLIIEEQKDEVENQRDIANTQKVIVEEKNKEILESITYAKRIQEAILPPPRLVKEWLTESFIFYKPKDIVAGDFYWMETATYKVKGKEKTLVYFAAADCTGHGVPGAMVSVVCANALNRAIKEFELIEPGQVLDKVTELVLTAFEKSEEDIKDGMDIALCALDISSKKIFYSGANNPLYRITSIKTKVAEDLKITKTNDFQLIEYKATKQPVGAYDNKVEFVTQEIQLEPGDAIYVFSDGFADQFGGEKGKKYKYSTFRNCLLDNFSHSMEKQKQLLEQEFNDWKGEIEQVDDVCVIGVKINGKEKKNFTQRELEVLSYLEQGLPSKLIAEKMFISKHTVDTYRRRLLAKTGTYNTTELINYCVKKEII